MDYSQHGVFLFMSLFELVFTDLNLLLFAFGLLIHKTKLSLSKAYIPFNSKHNFFLKMDMNKNQLQRKEFYLSSLEVNFLKS